MGTGDSAFGMRSDPMIPYDLMGVQSRISAQFINCPVNVPFCQRQECSSSFGNPQQNAMDCYRIAGCCFDNNLFVYKSAFGGSFFPAPVCYRAIRTPIFHALAEQITMKTNFLPNFLVPIADKVDVFLGDENRFNIDCRGSLNQIKSCSNRACPHQFGAQPNPYGTQLNYNNYNNNNNNNQAYGSNTNSFLNQMTNRQNQGQTNVNPYNNLFGGSTTNNQNTQSNLNQYNKLFGSSTTNNQGYFNQMQANPWGAVLSGFVGNSNNQNNNNNKNNFNSPWLG